MRYAAFFAVWLLVPGLVFVSMSQAIDPGAATKSSGAVQTIWVPTDFNTIQPAIDALASGDTIKLAPGVHSGPGNRDLDFAGKQIVVTSPAGPQWSTIDLGGSESEPHRLLQPGSPALLFDNVTITGGYADSGGVVSNSSVVFTRSVITGNQADCGAVGHGDAATITFRDCSVVDNVAGVMGGVFYRAEFAVEGSLIQGNEADSGGVVSYSSGRFTDCTIEDNVAVRGGCLFHAEVETSGTTFRSNQASSGGVSWYGGGVLTGCTFEANTAGEGSCFMYDRFAVAYCLFIDNGPGSLAKFVDMEFDHCTIVRNPTVVVWLDWYDGSAVLTNSIIAFNEYSDAYCEYYPDGPQLPYQSISAYFTNSFGNGKDYAACLDDDETRPGNMSLDPLFCDPDNNNFHLQPGSPCLGAGEDGTDIGAFGAGCIPTDVDDPADNALPATYALQQNYPNPFNPTTVIAFQLPRETHVRLEVFNMLGQQVRLLANETLPAGVHERIWDGTNPGGAQVSSGIYFYRLVTDHWIGSRKMLLLK